MLAQLRYWLKSTWNSRFRHLSSIFAVFPSSFSPLPISLIVETPSPLPKTTNPKKKKQKKNKTKKKKKQTKKTKQKTKQNKTKATILDRTSNPSALWCWDQQTQATPMPRSTNPQQTQATPVPRLTNPSLGSCSGAKIVIFGFGFLLWCRDITNARVWVVAPKPRFDESVGEV